MSVTIYHNPRCTSSRQALEAIRAAGIEPQIVHYLQTPPTRETLGELVAAMGMRPRDLLRRNEEAYKRLNLDDPKWSDDQIIGVMVENPILINRPIVVTPKGTVLARPGTKVRSLLPWGAKVTLGNIVLAVFGIILSVLVYIVHSIGWGGKQPTFYTENETSIFGCYMEKTTEDTDVEITFLEQGYKALVRSNGEEVLLVFVGSGLVGDRYGAGDVRLLIDPEAYIDGLQTGARGPCQNY